LEFICALSIISSLLEFDKMIWLTSNLTWKILILKSIKIEHETYALRMRHFCILILLLFA